MFAAVALAAVTALQQQRDLSQPEGGTGRRCGAWNLRTINGSTLPYFIDARTEASTL